MTYDVTIDGKDHSLELQKDGPGWLCKVDGREVRIDAALPRPDVLSLLVDGKAYEIRRETDATGIVLWVGNTRYAADLRDPRSLRNRRGLGADHDGPKQLIAPMPGKVVRVLVREKDEVEAGQGLLVVEAMKMQNELKSPKKGVVQKLLVTEGTAVNPGDVLAIVD